MIEKSFLPSYNSRRGKSQGVDRLIDQMEKLLHPHDSNRRGKYQGRDINRSDRKTNSSTL